MSIVAQAEAQSEAAMQLQRARKCAALTMVARDRGNSGAQGEFEAEISIMARDLAAKINHVFMHSTSGDIGQAQAFATSGKLQATLDCICELNERAERILEIADDAKRDALWCRIGWLHNAADDLAQDLAKALISSSVETKAVLP